MAERPAIAGADRATAHRYFDDFALRRLPAARATARQDTVTAAMAPPAEMFADAGGMVQLSRERARRRAGNFEIIEYVLRGQPGGLFDHLEERFARALIRTTLPRPDDPHRPLEPRRTHLPPTSRPTSVPPRRREPSPDWTSPPTPLA